ncbi:MAG: flagellar assembly protein FliW [Lawsonibacter sp.]
METATKYFGTVQYAPEDIISFPNGLFGFEEEKQFLLLPFQGSQGNLLCFQSLATPSLAFVAVNPFSLDPGYSPELTEEELNLMGVKRSQDLCYYALCVVREPVSESTVNLKCPVVIQDESRKAVQVILETKQYQMRHRLGEFSNKGANASC